MLTGIPKSSPLIFAVLWQYCEISASGNCSSDLLIFNPDRIYRGLLPEKFDRSGMPVRKILSQISWLPTQGESLFPEPVLSVEFRFWECVETLVFSTICSGP